MSKPEKYKLTPRQKRMFNDYYKRQNAAAQSIKPSIIAIDSIESLYKALDDRGEIKAKALLMLKLRNWLTEVSSFDPVSGHALHTGIVDFLDAVAKSLQKESPEGDIKDRIYRIVSHTKGAVLAIMAHTRDKILREHAMLPIHEAREVDSNSVKWLSRQPGRTLREKLSGKPYMKAVRRRHSVDTSENRLLKAYFRRLEQILFNRESALDETADATCQEFLLDIHRWFRSENASEIGVWRNLPPNNTLLHDKHYRKVWDGWLWLQSIDDYIKRDSERVHRDILSVIYWNTLSLLKQSGRFRTVQQPVGLDYDNFSINPELAVRGYLFPAFDSKIKGKIKFIKPDKSFGFITSDDGKDLFFTPYNLSRKLDINSLSAGDEVSFVIGSNRQGECADDITLPAGIIPVDFSLSGDTWEIQIGGDKYLLQIISGNLIIQQAQGTKKKLKIEPATLKEIPKMILSLVTDAPFEYFESPNDQGVPIQMDSSVVDLCSIRPMFINKEGDQQTLPFRLLQQSWTLKYGTAQVLDCGDTTAISLSDDIETVSMRSLFSHSSTLPDAIKSSASMFFTKKLNDYIVTDKLTWLVPDWGNDFDLEGVRKSINFYFDKSTPLPKSIAAIFAWQSSNAFKKYKLNERTEILVVDAFYGGFSVTPVTINYKVDLKKQLPETMGITWERHPTFIIENAKILDQLSEQLSKASCPFPKQVIQLFGLDGLIQDAGKLTFEKDSVPFHLPYNIKNMLHVDKTNSTTTSHKELANYLKNKQTENIFILPLSQSIIIEPMLKKFKQIDIDKSFSLTKGALTLEKWQEVVDDIALWRDHLPELSIRIVRDGHFENFYLVKDATVTPQRGRTVNIPVEESFTLPAGQTHYSFPLQQGEGNKELQFVAYMKSPAFPLKKAADCKLKMTYTYGADDPYELEFIPLNSAEAGFKSIRVEWRSASEGEAADRENLPVPDFPARKSWSDFQKFTDKKGKPSNLLSNITLEIDWLNSIVKYGRVTADISSEWKTNEKGNRFCFADDTYFSEYSFDLFNGQELPGQGDNVQFYKIERRGQFQAKNATIEGKNPRKLFSPKFYFSLFTIWNHGHSLSESDVPDHFRNAIFEGTQKMISIIESENMPDTLKEEIFFFLSCLHKDAPVIVGTRLLEAVKNINLLKKYNRNIAFAIGNVELPWQQELLDNIYKLVNNNDEKISSIALKILAVALWRSGLLIAKLTIENAELISNKLYESLSMKVANNELVNNKYRIIKPTVVMRLELLLALLRIRGNEGEGFKAILAPNKDLTKKYVELVDDISKVVTEKNIKLKSRISLQIDKPKMFRNTPDLLYALRMYLTGNSGANTIVITGVSDED